MDLTSEGIKTLFKGLGKKIKVFQRHEGRTILPEEAVLLEGRLIYRRLLGWNKTFVLFSFILKQDLKTKIWIDEYIEGEKRYLFLSLLEEAQGHYKEIQTEVCRILDSSLPLS